MMIVILVDLVIVALLVAADLISKHYVASYLLSHGGSYQVIRDVLTFRYSENRGAAFGIFEDSRVFLSVFVGVIILGLIAYLVYFFMKKKHREKGAVLLNVAISFVIAGGIGNLVDRIAFGYVRDFIEYTFIYTLFGRNFAICNLADVFLTIGVILIAIYLILYMIRESKKEKAAKAALSQPEREDAAPELPHEGEEKGDD